MNETTKNSTPLADAASFTHLQLGTAMQANLQQLGYTQMTPIQAASLPLALQGKDVIAQASTGSGKTAAFGLALLARLNPRWFAVQALVLCPTRELADQVATEIRRLARSEENIKVVTVYGGVPARNQIASLENGAHIIVGTPGRVMDLLERGAIDLAALNTLVLDEADRMLDMGFHDDITKVASQCPAERQTLLFSATYPDGIVELAARFMRQPQTVKVAAQHSAHKIAQRWYEVKESERLHAVSQLLLHFRPDSCIAFCNTKQQCRDLVAVLQAQGISALALFGELEQRERDEVLVQFANRSCSVLVATDVAARGLDIANLEAVINVDTTPDAEVHIHRIGRTGRGDAEGLALSLASMDEMGSVGRIEELQGRESEWHPLTDLKPASNAPMVPAMRTIQISGGRKEKIRAGDVLGAMTRDFGYAKEQIGKISVNDFSTYVAVARDIASQAVSKLNSGRVKGKSVKARLL
ncbi:ATP-dependent RNA helicase DbpA [Corticibacter populi]|uniref:ATP-dependent RNA helicase DbpA n=1 Tax=Corticibacter populi TaxID=1550736 RepID=A0A3M6QYA7_9BURK|nr:ATP-dependent RNA helicase DbpA [Corticibacter populi]RMX07987.1 ATP-dependent RNA helicase DbpA [Corticibacter populi]RZS35229.1 ATP-independent RNA helicase DbpA [Corticibacter populi]